MPLIQSIDDRWAKQVADKYQAMSTLTGKDAGSFVAMSGVASPGNGDGSGSQSSGQQAAAAMDESRLLEVERLAAQNPAEAALIVQSIGDPLIRATASTELALADSARSGNDTNDWLASAEKLALNAGVMQSFD